MLRENFVEMVQEQCLRGFGRGIDLFMEDLNVELAKDETLQENGLANVVDYITTKYLVENNLIER